ncbi:MAG: D-alanyl-D-alanine carboxypeptidase family protein [Pseudomonadota bacterium]
MKRWIVFGLIGLLWINPAYGKALDRKKGQPTKKISQSRPTSDLAKEDPFRAYAVMEGNTGRLLEGKEVHLKWPPASLTKLMVAYIVMEKLSKGELNLSDKITVSRDASKMGGSQVFLKEGEVFTLEEMMKAALIASANDATYAIGEFIAGGKEAFVKLMNEKAKALGMADTSFYSMHGLPPSKGEQEDLTSCHDLAVLARELLKYPKLLEWTSLQTASFRNGTFVLNNFNKLLGKMPGIDGLKTGYYKKAGYNIVATARKNGLRFIVVVMGSPKAKIRDHFVRDKINHYFTRYIMANVVKKGEVIDKEITLTKAKSRTLKGVANGDFSYPVSSDKKAKLKREITLPEKLEGEIKAGQKLGEILIRMDNEVVGKVDIVSPVHVSKAGFFARFF